MKTDTPRCSYTYIWEITYLNSISFYKTEFVKYNIYNKFTNFDIDKINENVINYLKNNEFNLVDTFFNNKEKEHLKDVRDLFIVFNKLFKLFLIVFVAIIFTLLLSKISYQNLTTLILNSFIAGSIICIGLILTLGLLIYFDFDNIFIYSQLPVLSRISVWPVIRGERRDFWCDGGLRTSLSKKLDNNVSGNSNARHSRRFILRWH